MEPFQVKRNFWGPMLLFKSGQVAHPLSHSARVTGRRPHSDPCSVPCSCPFIPKPKIGDTALLTVEVLVTLYVGLCKCS